jgi:hypothetical protein
MHKVEKEAVNAWEGCLNPDALTRCGHLRETLFPQAMRNLQAAKVSARIPPPQRPPQSLPRLPAQLAADTEFNASSCAGQFINSTFGWPNIMAIALPSGGPAYPFATPGVKIKLDPDKSTSLLLGVFNGDPAAVHRVLRPRNATGNYLPVAGRVRAQRSCAAS